MAKSRTTGTHRTHSRLFKLLMLCLVAGLLGLSPVLYHLVLLRQAQQDFSFPAVRQELEWFQAKGGLNKLPWVRDASLWLQLNTGEYTSLASLSDELQALADDKHLFWLFELELKEGRADGELLEQIQDPVLAGLGQGLLALAAGDAETSRTILTNSDLQWSSLSAAHEDLRHLALAQAALILNNIEGAQTELDLFVQSGSNNPLYLTVAFNQALQTGQWTTAQVLMAQIDAGGWRKADSEYLTQKALLALGTDDSELWARTIDDIEKYGEPGDLEYVLGVQAYAEGDLTTAESYLEAAVALGLDGMAHVDAEQALAQLQARLEAQPALEPLINGSGL